MPIFGGFLLFAIKSLKEKERRAFWFGLFFAIYLPTLLLVYPFVYTGVLTHIIIILQLAALLVLGFIFFYRFPQTRGIRIKESQQERFDERDMIFSRMRFKEGSPEYVEFYERNPELKEVDDRLRKMPRLSHPDTDAYDPLISPMMLAEFNIITNLDSNDLGEENLSREGKGENYDLFEITNWIKQHIIHSGATCCGITKINDHHLYSFKGISRSKITYGSPVINKYRYAIVFAVEMDYSKMQHSPKAPTVVETARKYVDAARIGNSIANYVNLMGYKARVELVGNYISILPALAYDAGLGELGRIGIIMTRRHGPRVRLGAVLTDMPLACDMPLNFGMQHFCELCTKCADCCPSKAIPKRGKTWVRGVYKWQLDPERCYRYWRKIGTDCGICIRVCPYSKPDNFLHNLVRLSSERSYLSRSIWAFADDLFYGRNPQKKVIKSMYSKH